MRLPRPPVTAADIPPPNFTPCNTEGSIAAENTKIDINLYTVKHWSDAFDERRMFNFPVESNVNGDSSSTCETAEDSFIIYSAGNKGPLFVCMHGAGHTAISFALLAARMKDFSRIFAYDCRGHGETQCYDQHDLSAETLVRDALRIITRIASEVSAEEGQHQDVVLVGHSMGGAIATKVAHKNLDVSLRGLVVLDVVEGAAMEALPHMKQFIQKFPQCFSSTDAAVKWALKAGIISNPTSAALSIPSQLKQDNDGKWRWRISLESTESYWRDWFLGTSALFISAPCARVCVLAGEDRLDKVLMIAHMQGKFQHVVIPKSGHIIEEDQPEHIATILLRFAERHKLIST